MHVTTITLFDGRRLDYYDSASGADRSAPDRRSARERAHASEIRRDPLLGQYVIVAPHRQDRTHMPSAAACPLCPSREGHLTEIPAPDYEVVVFENRFPALAAASSGSEHSAGTSTIETATAEPSLFESAPGSGRCEVICFTADHDSSFAQLTPTRARLVVEVWAERSAQLSRLEDVRQVFCFENRGAEIGVTETHPHGQIYAYPFETPRTRRMIDLASAHRQRHGSNLFDEVLAAEIAGPRLVLSTDHWIAFVPFAPRWPFELHLYPHRRVPDLPALDEPQRAELATVYLDVLGRFERLFPTPAPYIAAWHQAPLRLGREDFALHLEIFSARRAADKLKFPAGSEAAMDVFVGDIAPEEAARRLREV